MERESIISWTPTNWITVVLMVAVAYAAFGFATRLYQQRKAAAA